MRWLKYILLGLLALALIFILAVLGAFVALNSQSGRNFAVNNINKFGESYVHVGGLGGHFPSDIKISSIQLVDTKGVWLNGQSLELKWSPLALLHGNLSVQVLTARSISMARSPAYPASKKKGSSNFSLPNMRLNLDKLEIGALHIAPSLAGEDITLHVTGSTHLRDVQHGEIALKATTPSGNASYILNAMLDPQNVAMKLHVQEPPNGLLGHFAGPQVQQPLNMEIALAGPRSRAALQAKIALGSAMLNMSGAVGLDPPDPFADVVLTIPALAPFGALTQQALSGDTQLHLLVAQTAAKNGATLSLQGHVALDQAPAGLNRLLAGRTNISLFASLQGKNVTIGQLALKGPQFALNGSGMLGQNKLDLTTDAKLSNLAALAPQLAGAVQVQSHITGNPKDFAADAEITGQMTVPGVPTGPFNITLHAAHLPQAPEGSLTGTGMLAGAPLALNAVFVRNAHGASSVKIAQADWKSLTAQADLNLAAGARLPTGTAHIALGSLSDFDAFTSGHMHGAAMMDFAYQNNQNLTLNVTAKNIIATPSVGSINGTVSAQGQLTALAIQADATIARLMSYPARLSLAGVLNTQTKSASIARLNADWHGLAARLRGPADIESQPDVAVHHLNLTIGKTSVALDGTLSPTLSAKANVQNLDLAMARLFSPKLNAAGVVNLTAALTGTLKAPAGKVALNATGLRYIDKSTTGIPAASLSGTADLQGNNANINLAASAGQDVNLTARGLAPLSMAGAMKLVIAGRLNMAMLNPLLAKINTRLSGLVTTNMQLAGTPKAPTGQITLTAQKLHDESGPAASLPPADINAKANLKGRAVDVNLGLNAGQNVNFTVNGTAPMAMTGAMNLSVAGRLDLKLLDPILAANGNLVRGVITTNLRVSGTPKTPTANGMLKLAGGSVQNIASGLNLVAINADVAAANRLITLQSLSAKAGQGTISGHGTINLGAPAMPVDFTLNADHATPIASDLVTETLNAALSLKGDMKGAARLGGRIDILKANINIPKSLPPSVANLPIHNASAPPALPKSAVPPTPPIQLALDVHAKNQIFIRGDGLFAELGGHIRIDGTTDNPQPSGGFTLIRGYFSLAGKTLQFTSGKIDFNGGGFIPALDLEATTHTSNNGTATLVVGGTAAKPQISLSSSPPLPSDEILSQLLFSQSTANLSPFQAASLAAALAQMSGIGGGANPLDSVRNALGLDQLSLGSSATGAPSVQAGRYIAPGVYVGASQAASGQGTAANVEINLYKGLKLQTSTGTNSTGQNSSSVGLTYQFNY
ncbi:MAG: translocation/assembly module TamB domain-containing protein [Rhodospirillales bacterium]|nr:translocation/assembly module TamB domain-containing protein [Rhodospirillales bacterium]